LGAGDVFNAAVIAASLRSEPTDKVLAFACKVAGYKCGLEGFDQIDEVLKL
jgi:ketohexokinase